MTKRQKSKKSTKEVQKETLKLLKTEVEISEGAKKDFKKLPDNIKDSFQAWVKSVSEVGLAETGKKPGYNHEHLKGPRKGQRSARLNKAYRVIFTVKNGEVQIVNVDEINKHEY